MDQKTLLQPGPIALFGSGETAPGGQKIFDFMFRLSQKSPQVSIIETPAGFELNAGQVAENVGDFIKHRLQNYKPRIQLIPARKKGTQFSPDDPEIALPILKSDLIFMGPGSPSYAVRQLEDSLTWEYILARHRLGAALAFSSATTVAISSAALPVYEIYKVGEDPHWKSGLDFFSHYGLPLVFIPHWNNKDGGDGLDTSRCYMGVSRFRELKDQLPKDQVVIGIDENSGLVIDFQSACFHVVGQSNVTILREGSEQVIPAGSGIDLLELGDFNLCDPLAGISQTSWDLALTTQSNMETGVRIPPQVIVLAEKREKARQLKDWETADQLRQAVEDLGWGIQDNPDGFIIKGKLDQ
ncbi:MAG: cysteinyl-tRNA synthetase [Bacteroidetes bacterium]|nr:MAG: cysteinyl-tRNA synthetase [Bacteroidota bacterium]